MKNIIIIALLAVLTQGCSKDEDFMPQKPESTGTFIDSRDNKTYHYVTYCGLDWSVENLAYDLKDDSKCVIYKPNDIADTERTDYSIAEKYGLLYSYSAALEAVPEGWRVPTDEEWTQLESTNGYFSPEFNLLYAGYYTTKSSTSIYSYRFMGSWAFFWTSTQDNSKNGDYYFYRKIFYTDKQMTRYSMEPNAHFLSVRMVRDHKQNN